MEIDWRLKMAQLGLCYTIVKTKEGKVKKGIIVSAYTAVVGTVPSRFGYEIGPNYSRKSIQIKIF